MAASFLLSTLLKRFPPTADAGKLREAFPCCWVVWEPGAWKPPRPAGATLVPTLHARPVSGVDALAMALTPSSPDARQVTLGRLSSNDLEINDATVSKVHVVFMQDDRGTWTLRDAGTLNGTSVDGVSFTAGKPATLVNGARIQVGQVLLTFYTPEGLAERLKTEASATAKGP
jgi:hypothetical protein